MNIETVINKMPIVGKVLRHLQELEMQQDLFKSSREVSDETYSAFQEARVTDEYQAAYLKKNPLVSICVPTYNRHELLVQRSVKSILAQSYENIELLVIGDCCTDGTVEAMAEITDPRLKFVNLEERGRYPADPQLRWMVAGTKPVNHALAMAKGDFIGHLDDDDEYLPTRVEELVAFMQETRADFVWHPFVRELADGRWQKRESLTLRRNQVTTSTVFYHHWLKSIPWDGEAYKLREPGDWNRFRKILYLNAKTARYDQYLVKHFCEHNMRLRGK